MTIFPISTFARAILFDCDGTLINTEHAHFLSWEYALKQLGSSLTIDEYATCVGRSEDSSGDILSKKLVGFTKEDLLRIKREHFLKTPSSSLTPITDTVNFLKNLAENRDKWGIKIGVCSGAPRNRLLSHLKLLEIDHLLDIVLSGCDDLDEYSDPEGVNKPKPYIYQHAMKILEVTPEETIVIEDSDVGALAGVSAGCFTVVIPQEFSKNHNFSNIHFQTDSLAKIDIEDFLRLPFAKYV